MASDTHGAVVPYLVPILYFLCMFLPSLILIRFREHDCVRVRMVPETILICAFSLIISATELFEYFETKNSIGKQMFITFSYTIVEPLTFILTLLRPFILAHTHYCNMISCKTTQENFNYFSRIEKWILYATGFRTRVAKFHGTQVTVFNFSRQAKFVVFFLFAVFFTVQAVAVLGVTFGVSGGNIEIMEEKLKTYAIYYNLLSFLYAVASFLLLARLKKIRLPFSIYEEFLALSPLIFFGVPLFIALKVVEMDAVLKAKISRLAACVIFAGAPVGFTVFPLYLVFRTARNLKNLQLTKESLQSVINSPTMWPMLRKQLEHDFAIENAFFLEDFAEIESVWSEKVQDDIELSTPAACLYAEKSDAMWRAYFEASSPYQLNLSHKLSDSLKENLEVRCDLNFISLPQFEKTRNHVLGLILRNSFPRMMSETGINKLRTGPSSTPLV